MDGMVRLTGPFVPCHPKKYFYNFYPKKNRRKKESPPKSTFVIWEGMDGWHGAPGWSFCPMLAHHLAPDGNQSANETGDQPNVSTKLTNYQ